MVDDTEAITERYDYDAYGEPTIYTSDGNDNDWWDGDEVTGTTSSIGNSYLFTGRRFDILDNSSLKIQYSRNRYYDYYTGRWLTHDPLGITLNPQQPNVIDVIGQYKGGLRNEGNGP